MGEDFIRKTEHTYRRSLQRTVERRLLTPPLFQPTETTSTTYPCRLHDDAPTPDERTEYLLHRRDRDKIELLDDHRVIGTVDGEAIHDLNAILDARPDAAEILRVKPRRVDGNYLDFMISHEE
jgi:hypothetical protein